MLTCRDHVIGRSRDYDITLGLVVMAVMMVVMIMNIDLEAQDERINNSSPIATRVMVKYEEVDRGRGGAIGKSIKKLPKSRQKVEESSKRSKKP